MSFTDKDWCRQIHIHGDAFFDIGIEQSTCGGDKAKARPFDNEARRQFDQVKATIAKAGMHISDIEVYQDKDGRIDHADMAIVCFFCRDAYVYSMDKDSIPQRATVTPLGQHWYYVEDY
jgi:hypothetical protein